MSDGFRLASGLTGGWSKPPSAPVMEVVAPRSDSMGCPSITISGWLLPVMEVEPRMWKVMPEPGAPVLLRICTPAIRPCRASGTEMTRLSWTPSSLTELTAPVRSLFLTVPYPRTTTSSRDSTFLVSLTCRVLRPFSAICLVLNPRYRKTTTSFLRAWMRNCPLSLVTVRFPDCFASTLTPVSGCPSAVTRPLTKCCAARGPAKNRKPIHKTKIRWILCCMSKVYG